MSRARARRNCPSFSRGTEAGEDASWLTAGRVVEEIDADAMLERGVHPIGKIREAVGVTWSGGSGGVAQFVPAATADRDFATRRGGSPQFRAGRNAPHLVRKADKVGARLHF